MKIFMDIFLTHDELLKMTPVEIKEYFDDMTTIYSLLSAARHRSMDKESQVKNMNRPCNLKGWLPVEEAKS